MGTISAGVLFWREISILWRESGACPESNSRIPFYGVILYADLWYHYVL